MVFWSSFVFRFSCRYALLKKSQAPEFSFKVFSTLSASIPKRNVNSHNSVTRVDKHLRSLCKKSPFPYVEAVSLFDRSFKRGRLPSQNTCNLLVKTLANSGELELAFSVSHRMLHANILLQLVSLNVLIEYFICIDNQKLVCCVVGILLKRGHTGCTTLMYTILRYLCLCKDAVSICEFFHGMGTYFESLHFGVYKSLITKLNETRKLYESKDLMDGMKVRDHCPDILNYVILIEAFSAHGRMDDAMDFLEKMSKDGFRVDSFLYSRLLLGCSQNKDLHIGREIFRKMLERGSSPNLNHYNHLISLLCNSGMWNEVAGMLQSMAESGIEPNSFTYLCIIHGLCTEGKPKKAMDILNLELSKGVLPDSETFTIIINACCKEGLVFDACNILKVMLGRGANPANVATYNTLLIGLSKIGNIKEAMRLFIFLVKRSHVKPNTVTIETMVNTLSKKGHLDKATKIFDRMIERKIVMDMPVYTTLIRENLKVEYRIVKALSIWKQMLTIGIAPNSEVFSDMISGFCKMSCTINIAQGLFIKMRAYGVCPRLIDYKKLMSSLCKANSLEVAKRVFQELKIAGCEPDNDSYTVLIKALLKARDLRTTFALFTEMIRSGLTPHVSTCYKMINRFSKAGEMKKAVFVFDKMFEFGFHPYSLVYNALLKGLFLARERELIMRLLQHMVTRPVLLGSLTYITIIGCLCHISDDAYILYNTAEIHRERGYGEMISSRTLLKKVSEHIPFFQFK